MWLWIWIGIIIIVAIGAWLATVMPPVPGVTGPCEPSERERQDRQDRLTYEQSEQIRQWAKELLALDKSLNKWEIGFLVKITKTRLTLTERQGDKVHDMYLNYTGGGG